MKTRACARASPIPHPLSLTTPYIPTPTLSSTHLGAHGAPPRGVPRVHFPALDRLALRRLPVRADASQAEGMGAVRQQPEAAGDGLCVRVGLSVCVF